MVFPTICGRSWNVPPMDTGALLYKLVNAFCSQLNVFQNLFGGFLPILPCKSVLVLWDSSAILHALLFWGISTDLQLQLFYRRCDVCFQNLLVFNWIQSSLYQWNVPCATGCHTHPKHDQSTPMHNSWRGAHCGQNKIYSNFISPQDLFPKCIRLV